jgi:hypothetical protein
MPWVKVEYDDILRESESGKALLVLVDDEEIWLPVSQMDADYSKQVGRGAGQMYVTEWIAKEKELE